MIPKQLRRLFMKKTASIILSLLLLICLCACSSSHNENVEPTNALITEEPSAEPTAVPTEAFTESPTDEPVNSEEAPTAEPTSYLEALSETERGNILSFASDWYAEHLPGDEVLSMEFMGDDDPGYSYYPQYAPGEIIILKVVTSHEGYGSGVFRTCFITISPDGYAVINEGY
jgi:hypothetical protein